MSPEKQSKDAFPIQRTAREWALQYLYQLDISGDDGDDDSLVWFWEQIREEHPDIEDREWMKCSDRALALARGVRDKVADLDVRINACAVDWDLTRIAPIDRNILRLAAYEILYADTPAAVSIDEALEICRIYGDGNESTGFINGILDRIYREQDKTDDS